MIGFFTPAKTGGFAPTSACRTTVAASDLACFREIREQSACIELFRAGDASEFARVVSEILGDSDLRAGMEARVKEGSNHTAAEIDAKGAVAHPRKGRVG